MHDVIAPIERRPVTVSLWFRYPNKYFTKKKLQLFSCAQDVTSIVKNTSDEYLTQGLIKTRGLAL